MKPGVHSRKIAVEILYKVFYSSAYSNLILNNALNNIELSNPDKNFIFCLVKGTIQHQYNIDSKISSLSKIKLTKLNKWLLNILRLSIFQIDEMPNINPATIIDTSCELAKIFGHQGTVSFTNAVLRNYVRNKVIPQIQDISTDLIQEQNFIINKWQSEYSSDDFNNLMQWRLTKPKLTIRVNETNITSAGYAKILKNNHINFRQGQIVDSCFDILNYQQVDNSLVKIATLPGYSENLFFVQDETSALACKVLEPQANDLIIDMCAAPGGKSLYLSELMNNSGKIISVDKNAARLKILTKTSKALEIKNIQTLTCDILDFNYPILADKILLDAPCLGTGVVNKKPEIIVNKTKTDLENIIELQRKLLTKATSLVKPNGFIVYATCSLEREENIENVAWFLKTFPQFKLSDFNHFLPSELVKSLGGNVGYIQFVPYVTSNYNGFFIARFKYENIDNS